MIDDGSVDKSGEICDACALKDKRIKVIHKKNGGVSAARNTGLQEARGEYITYADSDDLVGRTIYTELIDAMEQNGTDSACCSYEAFTGAGTEQGMAGSRTGVQKAAGSSRSRVETVVLLSHKKADSYIHIDVEFGEGEGKIPVDSIAKRAEAYKPKEKVTYKMIKEYIEAKYGFKVHTAYIAEVKRNLGLPMYDAPNAVEELKQPRKHPTPEKVEAIKDALRYFAVI